MTRIEPFRLFGSSQGIRELGEYRIRDRKPYYLDTPLKASACYGDAKALNPKPLDPKP